MISGTKYKKTTITTKRVSAACGVRNVSRAYRTADEFADVEFTDVGELPTKRDDIPQRNRGKINAKHKGTTEMRRPNFFE